MPRGNTALEPGDHVFVALRTSLEPLIDRLFSPDPEPASLPAGVQLCFSSATTLEQLHRFFSLPLPAELEPHTAARRLGEMVAASGPPHGVRVGAFAIAPGADADHVAVQCLAEPT